MMKDNQSFVCAPEYQMGFEDRQYNRDDDSYSYTGNFGSGGGMAAGITSWSIVGLLIAINVAIFLADAFTPKVPDVPNSLHLINRFLALDTTSLWRVWSFLTHGFAHSSIDAQHGIWHIGGNMLTLFFLGRPVEQRLGRNEFFRFYILSVLISGAVFVSYNLATGQTTTVVGASGAVTAVVMLFIFMYPKETLLLMGVVPMRAWILGVLIVSMDFLRALDPENQIAWQAHLGGAAFGALYCVTGWNFSFLGNWLPAAFAKGGPARKSQAADRNTGSEYDTGSRYQESDQNNSGSFDSGSNYNDPYARKSGGGLGGLFKRKPQLKVHAPDDDDAFDELKARADVVLEKINSEGEQSLTRKERKLLNQYSEQLRRQRED